MAGVGLSGAVQLPADALPSRPIAATRTAWRLAWLLLAIWSAVGTVVVVGDLAVPGGGWADFVFLAFGALVVGVAAWTAWGSRHTLAAFAWVAVGSGLVETVGTLSGWPFGDYSYTDAMGPRLGVLPLAIPLAWWVVLVPLWVQARRWGGSSIGACLVRVAAVAVGAVMVDLVLEPVAWQLRGYWVWAGEGGSAWFGVPLRNFAGWAATAAVLTAGLELGLAQAKPGSLAARRLLRTAWVLALVVGIFGLTLLRQGGDYLAPGLLGLALAGAMWFGGSDRSDESD